jgi:hypothetical protein
MQSSYEPSRIESSTFSAQFFQRCIQVITELSHHYVHNHVGVDDFSGGTVGEASACLASSSRNEGSTKKDIFFGERHHTTAHRSASLPKRAANPYDSARRRATNRVWSVDSLKRSDVLIFLVPTGSGADVADGLSQTIDAVTEHVKTLQHELRLCSMQFPRRRCVLQDLLNNVYPKIALFLAFIKQEVGRSKAASRVVVECAEGIHSGNVLSMYHAVGSV